MANKRLVYAEDVKKEIDEWLDCVGTAHVGKGLSYHGELLGCIEDAPTIDAVPVVRGEWMGVEFGMFFECSKCGYSTEYNLTNFCPNCGADMRKGGSNE